MRMNLFQKPLIGLDISDHAAEAVLVARKGEACVVESYGRLEFEPGIVADGEIVDAGKLVLALRKLLRDEMAPPLPKGADLVAFALPEVQVHMHVFEVPRMADEATLGASLALEADGYFPYPHEELSAGHAVIAQRPDRKDVYYAAVRTSVLDAYRQAFEAAGLTPVAIEAESAAIARAVLGKDERDPVVLVDIGARVTDLSVYDRDGIHFSETIDQAGDAFSRALAEAGGLSLEEAENAKKERGIMGAPRTKGDRALLAAAEALFDDVEEAIAYYQEKYGRTAGKVLFCGGGAMMPGLLERAAERFGASAGRTVALADPWQTAKLSPKLEALGVRERGPLLATAVGLGLRGARVRKFPEIDFLAAAPAQRGHQVPLENPARVSERASVSSGLKIAGGLLILLLLATGAWFAAPSVSLWLKPAASRPASPAASPAVVTLRVQASMAQAFSEPDKTLSGAPVDLSFSATGTFAHAATATEGKAAGTIDIVNTTAQARTLVATTRFLSENFTLFRLDQTTSIPAHGRVSAAVTADQPGAQGDLPPGAFTIPGLSPALQRVVYGASTAPMRGGVTYAGEPYTEAERTQAIAAFRAKVELAALARATDAAGSGRLVPAGLLALDPLDIQGLPAVGAPTGDYELRAEAHARAYTLDREEIDRLLSPSLPAEGYVIGETTVTVSRFDPDAGTAALQLTATARRQ